MFQKISRRAILSSIGALSFAGNTTSQTANSLPSSQTENTRHRGETPPATEWIKNAVWESSGCATEIPLQVMYPGDTLLTIDSLTTIGVADKLNRKTAAKSTVQLQIPGTGRFTRRAGGFLSFAGDFLGPWVRSTWASVKLADRHDISINRSPAIDFIKRMQHDNGGFGPRDSFFYPRPISARMESTLYALQALQQLDALDPDTRSAAKEFLKRKQLDSGAWPLIDRTNDKASILGTYFALHALNTIDRLPPGYAFRAASFLRSRQMDDGGFYNLVYPITFTDESNANSTSASAAASEPKKVVTTGATARAILSLDRINQLHTLDSATLNKHAHWLAKRQVTAGSDSRFIGGFETRADVDAPIVDYRTNTRLALRALRVLTDHGVATETNVNAAADFLARCQHSHTGGIAAWPSYVTDNVSTAAAMRALNDLETSMPADSLATTFSRLQRANGRIPPLTEDNPPETKNTANALIALSNVGRLDAIDVASAAEYIANQQTDGGFAKYVLPNQDGPPAFPATTAAVFGLAATKELDRINKRTAGEYFANGQDSSGRIARAGSQMIQIADTSRSLQALHELGQLNLIDADAAATYLAELPAEDGEYWPSPSEAGWAVQGLATLDALDRIDVDATQSYLERNQYGSGGYAGRSFYFEYLALQQNAAAVAGLTLLGGSPTTDSEKSNDANVGRVPNSDSVEKVLRRNPGQGWLNSRDQLIAVDELPDQHSSS